MSKIIKIDRARKLGDAGEFNRLFKEVVEVGKGDSLPEEQLTVVGPERLAEILRQRLAAEIVKNKMFESQTFLCWEYIVKLLAGILSKTPKSWYAVDYMLSGQQEKKMKEAGDMCFIICGVFPERGGWRGMSIADYETMGANYYYGCYSTTKQIVWRGMSEEFQAMAAITHSSIAALQDQTKFFKPPNDNKVVPLYDHNGAPITREC